MNLCIGNVLNVKYFSRYNVLLKEIRNFDLWVQKNIIKLESYYQKVLGGKKVMNFEKVICFGIIIGIILEV